MSSTSLYITYLEKEGPFLKIWGQLDKNTPIAIDKALADATLSFTNGHHIPPSLQYFSVGNLCCAKFSDDAYYRAKFINVDSINDGYVEVLFVDYGNTDIVQCKNIRTMAPFSQEFINIGPQAREFYLMNVTHNGNNWDPVVLEHVMQMIRYVDVAVADVIQVGSCYLIKLMQNGQELSSIIKNAGYGVDVPTHIQQTLIHKSLVQKMQESPQLRQARINNQQLASPSTIPNPVCTQNQTMSQQHDNTRQQIARPTILTFKSTPLEPNSEHEIYVSYVTDGPLLFSIQLKKTEENLRALMNEINTVSLRPFADTPTPSTMCLAQSSEDGYICRAVVTNMMDGEYKIYYVDFGNTEMRSIDYIFEIPYKFIIPKLMATRFALDGFDKTVVTVHMKVAFKEFVENRQLNIRVKSRCVRTGLPLCDIWDENDIHAIDVVKQAATDAYADPVHVSKGSAHPVRVSAVYSCNRFYMQFTGKNDELQSLLSFMQESCPSRKPLDAKDVFPGKPCAAQLGHNGTWQRALITEAFENGTVKLFFVDFGLEDTLHSRNLKQANYDQITKLRPQALQCSLNGYQNMAPDIERDTFLNEILLNQQFTAKVVDVLGSIVLVDMIDAKNYNVGSLLMEKLANSRSQISPLLIQDSNKIEIKKRHPQPLYENKPYNRDGFMSRHRNVDESIVDKDRNYGVNQTRGNYQKKKFGSGTDSGSEKDNSPDITKTHLRPNKSYDRANDYGDFNANKFSRNQTKDTTPPIDRYDKVSSKASDGICENWEETNLKSTNANQFVRKDRRDLRQDGENDSRKGAYTKNVTSPPKNESNPALADVNSQYETQMLVGNTKNVGICWFHNPGSFFVQLEDYKSDLKSLMNSIQSTYKRRRTITPIVSQAVIAQYPADNAYYRAIVLDIAPGKCKVQYVDFGNISGTTNIFAIEKQHLALPAQAVRCQLSGVKPIESVWPKANLMQKHFDVDVFTCEFVSEGEDRFEVTLTQNNSSIADILIANNLATALKTLELPLLLCQEIKVLVNTVNSLSDFIVEVQPNVKVQCTLHNLTNATETFEEVLKELVGYFVIAYFDQIDGTRAHVTLYDTFGVKLTLIKPDDGALESISPLCAMPVFLSTIEGFVSHATETSIFVQPLIYTSYISQLLNDMHVAYNNVDVTEPVILEKGFEYAVLSTDENWYRGKIIFVDGDNVTVHYIDYGNDETVNKNSLRILDGTLYDPHELCIEISTNGKNVALIDTELVVNVAYGDNGWIKVEKEVKSEVKEGKMKVMVARKLEIKNQTFVEVKICQETSLKEEIELSILVKEQIIRTEEIVQDVAATDTTNESYGIPIVISHIDTPNMFYVQLAQDLEAIDALQANIVAQIDMMLDVKKPTVGMLCAALYNENNEWYRAEVIDIKEQKITVHFVDYGNCCDINSTETKLKILPTDIESLERYARPCSLYISSIGGKTDNWSPEICARFEKLAYVDDLYAEIIRQDDDITYIHIYHNDCNLAEVLVIEKCALKMGDDLTERTSQTPPTTASIHTSATSADSSSASTKPGIAVIISHIDSPGQFYVQLSSDLDAIDALQAKLQSQIAQLADVETATAGVLCAAIYSANQEWYRAQVLDTDADITTVRFVDYGNTDVLDNSQTKVKTLSPELLTLEQYARRCSLYITPSIESSDWSQEACVRFEELAYLNNDIRAEIIERDDKTTYINLFSNEINIGQVLINEKLGQPIHFEIEATYPTGFISHVNSPSEFWIQLESACGDLERIADQLERGAGNFGTLNDMSPGTLCAAVFPDDDNWYRARILSNTVAGLEVLFIDYGNSCTCTNLRELPEDFVMTAALAQKCCLQKPNGVLQWSPTATETFKQISADGRTIFVVHNLIPGETTTVQLHLDDQDITQHLLPITTEGFITHIDKLDSIWITKSSDLPKLEKWRIICPNAKNWPKTNKTDQIVAAYNKEDSTWYRAKVTEQSNEEFNVLLIDYGVNMVCADIRTWPDDYLDECEPLAKKYKLLPLPGFKWTTDSEMQLKSINNNGKTIFHVEYVGDDVVQLYNEMQDVRSYLDAIKSTPITSLQNTPTKKDDIYQQMDVFHAEEEDNPIIEAKHEDIQTDTLSEDLATTTSAVELLQSSGKSPECAHINKSLDAIKSTPITSLQNTPKKKVDIYQQMDVFHAEEEDNLIIEAKNDDIQTDTLSEDLAATTIAVELLQSSGKSPECAHINKSLDAIKSTPITSLQNTPKKKDDIYQKMDVFHAEEQDNLIIEAKNDDIQTDILSEDLAATTSAVELLQSSGKSSECVPINKSLLDTLNPIQVVQEDVKVSDSTESEVNDFIEHPEIINEPMTDSNTSNNAVKGILVIDSVKSCEKSVSMIDNEASNNDVEGILNELVDNSVKTSEIYLPDDSECFRMSIDSLNDAKEIVNELVENSITSPAKQICNKTLKIDENTKLPVVTDILKDIVTMSVDMSNENIVAISTSGFVDEIVDNATLNVENSNYEVTVKDESVIARNTEKSDVENINLDDSVELHFISAKGDNNAANTINENIKVSTVQNAKDLSTDIINSIVDGFD